MAVTLEELNDHVRTYPDPNQSTGAAWTTAERAADIERIKGDLTALIPAPDAAAIQASIDRANAVNAKLENLKISDPTLFETVRFESFEQQAARFGL